MVAPRLPFYRITTNRRLFVLRLPNGFSGHYFCFLNIQLLLFPLGIVRFPLLRIAIGND